MVKNVVLLIYCYSYLCCDVCGQRACSEDSNVLDSCDSHVISNNNIYVDFGVIESQCSCIFSNALNAQLIYSLSEYPRYDCGTAIQIKGSNGVTFWMPCTSSVSNPVFSSLPTTVELVYVDSTYRGDTKYCFRVLSNSRYHA